jgi:hypothetical protein
LRWQEADMGRQGTGRRTLTAALLLGLAAIEGPARADETPGAVPLDALTAAVAAWTAERMGLPLPDALPRIVLRTPDEMARLRAGGAPAFHRSGGPPLALYARDGATILLPSGWSGRDMVEVSVLVHEMAHHLQATSGRPGACPAAAEAEAFAVQSDWLRLFGGDLGRDLGIDGLYLRLLGACGF